MTVRIHYETPDGIETIERDERVYTDNYVSAYNNLPDEPGVSDKVEIPGDRVIRVTHDGQEWQQ